MVDGKPERNSHRYGRIFRIFKIWIWDFNEIVCNIMSVKYNIKYFVNCNQQSPLTKTFTFFLCHPRPFSHICWKVFHSFVIVCRWVGEGVCVWQSQYDAYPNNMRTYLYSVCMCVLTQALFYYTIHDDGMLVVVFICVYSYSIQLVLVL